MTKGKLQIDNETAWEILAIPIEVFNEAKQSFPKKPKNFGNKDDLLDYSIDVHCWYIKYFGDE